MRRGCIVLASLLWAAPAWAQDAPVPAEEDWDDEELVLDEVDGDEDDEPEPEPEPAGEPDPDVEVEDESEAADGDDPDDPYRLREIIIRVRPKDLVRVGGSAHVIDEKLLEDMEYDDPNSVLALVPGVYLRQEDGYGLRPNIGLRGANSERSKKVTLMEDGVLFGPAPYAAPAAYYFPMMTRMANVEVFKGPSAIEYGPNTIGGAINMTTRAVPRSGWAGGADLAYGKDNYLKLHGHAGLGETWGGFLLEAAHLRSDGFKRLDGGGDTGFVRTEVMAKGMLQTDPLADVYHRLELKLGFSHEISDETYLGLTDADFRERFDRRYRASALDRFDMERWQIELRYLLQVGEGLDVTATFYRHDLRRAWRKLNGFAGGPSLGDILADPTGGERAIFYSLLKGDSDTASTAEQLIIGTNARTFLAQGLDLGLRWQVETGPVAHDIQAGVRVHHDEIERNHTEDLHLMQNGRLVREGSDPTAATLNTGSAVALAAHLLYGLHGWNLTLTPGLRFEYVHTVLRNHLTDDRVVNDTPVALPGLGVHYAFTNELGVLAGVHMGFSPVAPGQPDTVEPEQSVNYEFGVRYADPDAGTLLEGVGFVADYTNLVGECTFSAGCGAADLDSQFNAGRALIAGVEVVLAHRFTLPMELELPVRASYTFTHTELLDSFTSSNPQLGTVEAGDELPYVPAHQASLVVGLDAPCWGFELTGTFQDAMRETAGQGDALPGEVTDQAFYLDVSGRYSPLTFLELYLKLENLLMQEPIASRRPFGARPGKPFMVMGGAKANF